jgi:hypothetical protein
VIHEIESDSIDELVWKLNEAETYFIQVHRACNPNYGYNVEARGHSFTDAREIIRNKFNELIEENASILQSLFFMPNFHPFADFIRLYSEKCDMNRRFVEDKFGSIILLSYFCRKLEIESS